MNISELIKEAHDNAVEKGFYDLCDCNEGFGYNCSLCNNETGVIQNRNIGELLMLIVSELGEALEAHRCNRFVDVKKVVNNPLNSFDFPQWKFNFEACIKDTFEDEIADVFIRLFSLCGYLGWELKSPVNISDRDYSGNIAELLLHISDLVIDIGKDAFTINIVLNSLWHFCKFQNIPIEKHIKAKMAYNRIRPHKHGKEY